MDPYGSDVDGSLGPVAVILLLLFYVAIIGFGIYMVTRVAKKAGYPWGYGLLYLIPVVNLVILVMFVFSKWPVERELEQLRAQAWAGYGQGGYPQTGYPQAGYPQAGASGTHPAFGSSGGHPAFGAQPTYGSTTPTYGAPGAYPASGDAAPGHGAASGYGTAGYGYGAPADGDGTPGWPPADPGQQPRPGGYPPA